MRPDVKLTSTGAWPFAIGEPGFMARESPDGNWLYYSRDGSGKLWRTRLHIDRSGVSGEEL